MENSEVKKAVLSHAKAKWNKKVYIINGFKTEWNHNELSVSIGLIDDRRCIVWVKLDEVELIKKET